MFAKDTPWLILFKFGSLNNGLPTFVTCENLTGSTDPAFSKFQYQTSLICPTHEEEVYKLHNAYSFPDLPTYITRLTHGVVAAYITHLHFSLGCSYSGKNENVKSKVGAIFRWYYFIEVALIVFNKLQPVTSFIFFIFSRRHQNIRHTHEIICQLLQMTSGAMFWC